MRQFCHIFIDFVLQEKFIISFNISFSFWSLSKRKGWVVFEKPVWISVEEFFQRFFFSPPSFVSEFKDLSFLLSFVLNILVRVDLKNCFLLQLFCVFQVCWNHFISTLAMPTNSSENQEEGIEIWKIGFSVFDQCLFFSNTFWTWNRIEWKSDFSFPDFLLVSSGFLVNPQKSENVWWWTDVRHTTAPSFGKRTNLRSSPTWWSLYRGWKSDGNAEVSDLKCDLKIHWWYVFLNLLKLFSKSVVLLLIGYIRWFLLSSLCHLIDVPDDVAYHY